MGAATSNDSKTGGPYFDCNKSSPDLLINEADWKVTFPRGSDELRIVSFNQTLKTGSYKNQFFYVRVKIDYDGDSRPVLGFSKSTGLSFNQPLMIRNFYLFDISKQRLLFNHRDVSGVLLPPCQSGSVIECQIDIGQNILQYNVCGSNTDPLNFKFDGDIPKEITPILGAINTNESVAFNVLEVAKELMPFEDSSARFEGSYGPVLISEDGKTVSRSNINSNCCSLINKVLNSGKHRWTFQVINDEGASLCLGIAKHPVDIPSKFSNSNIHIYYHEAFSIWRSYGGEFYSNGSQWPHKFDWKNATNVEFVLDLSVAQGTLEIIRDGTSLGVIFDNVQPPVQPVVLFYSAYEKEVQLSSFKSSNSMQSSATIPLHITKDVDFCFDRRTLTGQLLLSPNGLTLSRLQNHNGNAYCLLNQICSGSGLYHWSFVINRDEGASTCLGITKEPVHLPNNQVYFSRSMWLYRSYTGALYKKGVAVQKHFASFFMPHTVVELVLDMDNHVLQYIVNGENQGIAFVVEPGCYRPVVAFYAGMPKSITLQEFNYYPSAKLLTTSSHNDLDQTLNDLNSQELPSIFGEIDIIPGQQTDTCIVCEAKDQNIVLLPCKHAIYCAVHISIGERCIACGEIVEGFWNVF